MPVDETHLPEKLAIGNRVMRTWPLREVVLRQCVLLALAGRDAEARALLEQARRTFPNWERMIRDIVRSAPEKARKTLDSAPETPRQIPHK
jgi:ATP-dependent protease HslVU (ClpYQ) peptidase subunit